MKVLHDMGNADGLISIDPELELAVEPGRGQQLGDIAWEAVSKPFTGDVEFGRIRVSELSGLAEYLDKTLLTATKRSDHLKTLRPFSMLRGLGFSIDMRDSNNLWLSAEDFVIV